MDFKLDSFFNPHLPPGATRVEAVVSVTATGGGVTAGPRPVRTIVFVLDESGSMDGDKWEQATRATMRCIRRVPDGDRVAVIAFSDTAQVVVSPTAMSEGARIDAERRVGHHRIAKQGTQMSSGLQALEQVVGDTGGIAYAMFLTDGQNSQDDAGRVKAAVERLRGRVEVDCRGVGTDWEPRDLRVIASGLLGTADAVPEPERLEADFEACLRRVLAKETGGVALRLWHPASAKILFVKQMTPEEITLAGTTVDKRTVDFALGSWAGDEARDYHLAFEVEASAVGDEAMACRPSIAWAEHGADRKAQGTPVVVTWSEDEAMTTRINPEVAHATGQAEIATSIRDGLEARARGDEDGATRLLGRAAKLAEASGNEEVTRRLSKVVDVIDAEAGTVRLRRAAGKAEALELEMGSTRTVRRARS